MGSAIRYRIVRCTEETQAYPDFFPFISFLLALLVLEHRHFGRVFSYFPTQPLHNPSRIDRGELSGAIVWPRGSIAAADNGGQALARDLTSARNLSAGTSTSGSAGIRPTILG